MKARRSEWDETRALIDMSCLGMVQADRDEFIEGARFGIHHFDRPKFISGLLLAIKCCINGGRAIEIAKGATMKTLKPFDMTELAAAFCGFPSVECTRCGKTSIEMGQPADPFICGYCHLEKLTQAQQSDWADGNEAA